MTAKEVKKIMISRLNWFNGYMGAASEVTNHHSADIIGVRFAGRTVVEYEIKVSRGDLVGELKAVRAAYGLDEIDSDNLKVSHTKFNKHCHYQALRYNPPHLFYFCLPTALCDIAVAQLQGIPYGVYDFERDKVIKKPRRLHSEPITTEKALQLFARACTERIWNEI